MNIKELITILNAYDSELEVNYDDGECGERDIERIELKEYKNFKGETKEYLLIS